MSIFNWRNDNKGSSTIGKERLRNMLNSERGVGLVYLEELKKDITDIVLRYTNAYQVHISTEVTRDRNIDIRVSLNNNK